MSDTSEEKAAVIPLISITSLQVDLAHMRFSGFWPTKIEVGFYVFEMLVNEVIATNPPISPGDYWTEEKLAAREERMRKELWMGLTDMAFSGVPVVYCSDVPDGKLWPSREKGKGAAPFAGTEAADVHSA